VSTQISPSRIEALDLNAKFPMGKNAFYQMYKKVLSPIEVEELRVIPKIYFIGSVSKRIVAPQDSGSLKLNMGDHLVYRFEVKTDIQNSSFSAYDHKRKAHCKILIH